MLVGLDTLETFQHFISLDGKAFTCHLTFGENSSPDGMGMQDRAGASSADDGQMKQIFKGRPGAPGQDFSSFVDFQDVGKRECAFVHRGGRNGETQRIRIDHCTEVAGRAEHPAARVELLADSRQG